MKPSPEQQELIEIGGPLVKKANVRSVEKRTYIHNLLIHDNRL